MNPEQWPIVPSPAPQSQTGVGFTLRSRPVVAGLAAAIVVLLLLGGVLVWTSLANATAGEVFLEAVGAAGRDPFTGDVVVGNLPGVKSQTPLAASSSGGGIPTINGETPALYGGSRNEKVCDKQKLIDFLGQNPDKAAAWAGVLGVQPVQVADYVGALTPLQLRADTRVTNHGYSNGHATPRQSVLQAGTAVLVDELGRPRVKCGCGNPLAEPVALSGAARFDGDAWPDFSTQGLVVIAPAARPIDRFVIVDPRTGESLIRPHGTDGGADEPTNAPVTPTTPAVAPCPDGQPAVGGLCGPGQPVVCPAGQDRVDGRCVPRPVTCPPGTHPVSGGTACERDGPLPVGAPTGLTITRDSFQGARSAAIDLAWQQPALNGNELVNYSITVTNLKGPPLSTIVTSTVPEKKQIQGDRCLAPYRLEVRAVTRAPASTATVTGPPATLTSQPHDCTIKMAVAAQPTGPRSASVSISQPGGIDPYVSGDCSLLFNGTSKWSGVCGGTKTPSAPVAVTGLNPATAYQVVLRTKQLDGSTTSSNTVTVMTPSGGG